MNPVLVIPVFAGATAGTLLLGLLSKWIDRKVTARIQWRKGPPWYQPFADVLKLLGKETIVPEAAGMTGFLLAPLLGFAAVSVAATILWVANFSPESGFVGDVIVVLYLLTVPSLALILGGSASGNPLASVGAGREMKLIISYELPMLLAVLSAIAGSTNSFNLGGLAIAETNGLPATIGCVIGFIVILMCIQAKLGLVPFDIAEAGCEIASGPYIEYSGAPLAIFYLTKAMLLAVMPMFAVTVFWGGFSCTNADGDVSIGNIAASIGKYVLILVVLTLLRNTNPRVRIDHAMRFFWFIMTPLAVTGLVLSMF
ncbi:MAG: NADH-quinone oxidoreductase subunit H [Sedimentisphaerales bacterium]|nr:NADH-quinone oxidoreductase subunit H [Sedimentisphaerales bacterium]